MGMLPIIEELLAERGVNDPVDYLLSEAGEEVRLCKSDAPDLQPRGNVLLMFDRTVSREDVARRFDVLKNI